MRKFLLFLVLCIPSQAAIALVNHGITVCTSSPCSVTSSPINMTGANLVILGISNYQNSTWGTVSDSSTNTWNFVQTYTDTQSVTSTYYCYPCTVSSNQTFSVTGLNYGVVTISGWSGSGGIDGVLFNGAAPGGLRTSLQPGSITPSKDGDLIFVMGGSSANSGLTFSATLPTMTLLDSNSNGSTASGGDLYYIQSTAAAINPTVAFGANTTMAVMQVAFKPAAASLSSSAWVF